MTQKIRLCSLATTYPESGFSKIPKFVHLLNMELAKLGLEVIAIIPQVKGSLKTENLDGVQIKRFRYLPERYEMNTLSIPDEIKKSRLGYGKVLVMLTAFFISTFFSCIKDKPDIIHGQWAFPGGFIAYMMSKIFSKKSVTTVHHGEIPLIKRFKLLQRMVVHALNNSSKVIAVSNHTKNQLISIGVRKEQIAVIKSTPNFVDHTSDIEFLNQFRSKFVPPEHKIILFCGRIVAHKGVEYLIKSLPEIKTKNVHLIVIGDGFLLKQLKELVASLNLKNRVTFFGSASHEELGWLHDISDIFVMPSIVDADGQTEGLGLVIPEAMESQLPVVATSVGGILDIVKNEVNGLLIPPKDPASIAKAIERIILDEELVKKIVENAKKTVNEFSPRKIAQEYLDIFKTLVN